MRWFEDCFGGSPLTCMVFQGWLFLRDVGWRFRVYLSGIGKDVVASVELELGA